MGEGVMQDPKQKEIDALKTASKIKIYAEFDHNSYAYRPDRYMDAYDTEEVSGWLIRINGIKFPRPKYDYDVEDWDWSWRYTPKGGNSEEAKEIAIENAMIDAKLPWSMLKK